jgi:hypothetical protein
VASDNTKKEHNENVTKQTYYVIAFSTVERETTTHSTALKKFYDLVKITIEEGALPFL